MFSTEQCERVVQAAQEDLERRILGGNEYLIAMARQTLRDAEQRLHEARLKNGDYL